MGADHSISSVPLPRAADTTRFEIFHYTDPDIIRIREREMKNEPRWRFRW